jgi:SAM-dependent methyltransferase
MSQARRTPDPAPARRVGRAPAGGRLSAALLRRIDAALLDLRQQGRRAVAIVELGCGDGTLLIGAARRAAMLGFLAVEGIGADLRHAALAAARTAARRVHDRRIGLSFRHLGAADVLPRLEDGADLILCHDDAVAMLDAAAHGRLAAQLAQPEAGMVICLGERP